MAVIGTGLMGSSHATWIQKHVREAELVAVCDTDESRRPGLEKTFKVPCHPSHRELLRKEKLDAVVIATPHPKHVEPAVDAFRRGLHVLSEKAIASTASDGDRMVRAGKKAGKIFAVMFQSRALPVAQFIKKTIAQGKIGRILRAQMVGAYFRNQAYYNAAGWRGTWDLEGGGVLLNQAPHDMDLFLWFVGRPVKVLAKAKSWIHRIEVENYASAILTLENGAHALFHVGSCEFPSRETIEIVGDKGTILCRDGQVRLGTNRPTVTEGIRKGKGMWETPKVKWTDKKLGAGPGALHLEILRNFARAIRDRRSVYCTGEEGLAQLEVANAIILSSETEKEVSLPLDRKKYDALLRRLIRTRKLKNR